MGAPPLFSGGERGRHLTQSCPRPRPTSIPSGIFIYAAICLQRIWAENWDGGLSPFEGEGAGSSSNTIWPGPRPTCMPSFILIHQTVWPQYINVTDKTGQTDRQRSDSIERTVLQTVAFPKMKQRKSVYKTVYYLFIMLVWGTPGLGRGSSEPSEPPGCTS